MDLLSNRYPTNVLTKPTLFYTVLIVESDEFFFLQFTRNDEHRDVIFAEKTNENLSLARAVLASR